MKRKREQKSIGRVYSGEASRPLWNRIKMIKDADTHDLLYTVGCHLQDIEIRMLQLLELAEKMESKQ